MKMFLSIVVLFLETAVTSVLADGPATGTIDSVRYGPFGVLDHRSIYGKDWFPEPLEADESDVDNEVSFNWFHAEKPHRQDDELQMEIEKSFGLFTFEVAPSRESDRTQVFNPLTNQFDHDRDEGFGNVEFGGRFPFYQYVSPSQFFDTTFVFGTEVTLPTHTRVSRDVELVPKVFNLTRIGDHFAIETGLGDSILVGPDGRGLSTIEYNALFAYELTHQEFPIPFVASTWPLLEFDGEHTVNQDDAGHDELFGTAGFRFNLDYVKWLGAQPKIGIGYTFPLDSGARDEFHWGIDASIIFEF